MVRLSRSDDTGAVAILVALLAIVLFGFAAIIVDLGMARGMRQTAQVAADAAALAGVGDLNKNPAAGKDYVEATRIIKRSAWDNYLSSFYDAFDDAETAWQTCSAVVPSGWWQGPVGEESNSDCIVYSHNGEQVQVVLPDQRSGVLLGGIVGYGGLTIGGAMAQAEVPSRSVPLFGPPSCVLCVLGGADGGPVDHVFKNSSVTATGGRIGINGDVELQSTSGSITAAPAGQLVTVEGSVDWPNSVSTPNDLDAGTRTTDPLLALYGPSVPASMVEASQLTPKSGSPCSGGPGIYDGYVVPAGITCTLNAATDGSTPPLYVFTSTIAVQDAARLQSSGVAIYFACGTGTSTGPCTAANISAPRLVASQDAVIQLVAPADDASPSSQRLKGLAMIFDNEITGTLALDKLGPSTVQGTVYAPGGHLDETSEACAVNFRSIIVLEDLDLDPDHGGCLAITYAESDNVRVRVGTTTTLEVPVLLR